MITVLRIGHRPERDKRITTHVALVARAFGADRILVDRKDSELERNFQGVCERFGGNSGAGPDNPGAGPGYVGIQTGVKWRQTIKNWKGQIVHLTMYGEEFETGMKKVTIGKDLLLIVGAEKVPREVYEMADLNISVGNQPHSEVAALAVFLYRYFGSAPFRDLEGGQMRIMPDKRGKTVVEK
jgi:tRNA (cytidine56-2'-O)-methyltransferase